METRTAYPAEVDQTTLVGADAPSTASNGVQYVLEKKEKSMEGNIIQRTGWDSDGYWFDYEAALPNTTYKPRDYHRYDIDGCCWRFVLHRFNKWVKGSNTNKPTWEVKDLRIYGDIMSHHDFVSTNHCAKSILVAEEEPIIVYTDEDFPTLSIQTTKNVFILRKEGKAIVGWPSNYGPRDVHALLVGKIHHKKYTIVHPRRTTGHLVLYSRRDLPHYTTIIDRGVRTRLCECLYQGKAWDNVKNDLNRPNYLPSEDLCEYVGMSREELVRYWLRALIINCTIKTSAVPIVLEKDYKFEVKALAGFRPTEEEVKNNFEAALDVIEGETYRLLCYNRQMLSLLDNDPLIYLSYPEDKELILKLAITYSNNKKLYVTLGMQAQCRLIISELNNDEILRIGSKAKRINFNNRGFPSPFKLAIQLSADMDRLPRDRAISLAAMLHINTGAAYACARMIDSYGKPEALKKFFSRCGVTYADACRDAWSDDVWAKYVVRKYFLNKEVSNGKDWGFKVARFIEKNPDAMTFTCADFPDLRLSSAGHLCGRDERVRLDMVIGKENQPVNTFTVARSIPGIRPDPKPKSELITTRTGETMRVVFYLGTGVVQFLVKFPSESIFPLSLPLTDRVSDIKAVINTKFGVESADYYLTCGYSLLDDDAIIGSSPITRDCTVKAYLRMRGGAPKKWKKFDRVPFNDEVKVYVAKQPVNNRPEVTDVDFPKLDDGFVAVGSLKVSRPPSPKSESSNERYYANDEYVEYVAKPKQNKSTERSPPSRSENIFDVFRDVDEDVNLIPEEYLEFVKQDIIEHPEAPEDPKLAKAHNDEYKPTVGHTGHVINVKIETNKDTTSKRQEKKKKAEANSSEPLAKPVPKPQPKPNIDAQNRSQNAKTKETLSKEDRREQKVKLPHSTFKVQSSPNTVTPDHLESVATFLNMRGLNETYAPLIANMCPYTYKGLKGQDQMMLRYYRYAVRKNYSFHELDEIGAFKHINEFETFSPAFVTWSTGHGVPVSKYRYLSPKVENSPKIITSQEIATGVSDGISLVSMPYDGLCFLHAIAFIYYRDCSSPFPELFEIWKHGKKIYDDILKFGDGKVIPSAGLLDTHTYSKDELTASVRKAFANLTHDLKVPMHVTEESIPGIFAKWRDYFKDCDEFHEDQVLVHTSEDETAKHAFCFFIPVVRFVDYNELTCCFDAVKSLLVGQEDAFKKDLKLLLSRKPQSDHYVDIDTVKTLYAIYRLAVRLYFWDENLNGYILISDHTDKSALNITLKDGHYAADRKGRVFDKRSKKPLFDMNGAIRSEIPKEPTNCADALISGLKAKDDLLKRIPADPLVNIPQILTDDVKMRGGNPSKGRHDSTQAIIYAMSILAREHQDLYTDIVWPRSLGSNGSKLQTYLGCPDKKILLDGCSSASNPVLDFDLNWRKKTDLQPGAIGYMFAVAKCSTEIHIKSTNVYFTYEEKDEFTIRGAYFAGYPPAYRYIRDTENSPSIQTDTCVLRPVEIDRIPLNINVSLCLVTLEKADTMSSTRPLLPYAEDLYNKVCEWWNLGVNSEESRYQGLMTFLKVFEETKRVNVSTNPAAMEIVKRAIRDARTAKAELLFEHGHILHVVDHMKTEAGRAFTPYLKTISDKLSQGIREGLDSIQGMVTDYTTRADTAVDNTEEATNPVTFKEEILARVRSTYERIILTNQKFKENATHIKGVYEEKLVQPLIKKFKDLSDMRCLEDLATITITSMMNGTDAASRFVKETLFEAREAIRGRAHNAAHVIGSTIETTKRATKAAGEAAKRSARKIAPHVAKVGLIPLKGLQLADMCMKSPHVESAKREASRIVSSAATHFDGLRERSTTRVRTIVRDASEKISRVIGDIKETLSRSLSRSASRKDEDSLFDEFEESAIKKAKQVVEGARDKIKTIARKSRRTCRKIKDDDSFDFPERIDPESSGPEENDDIVLPSLDRDQPNRWLGKVETIKSKVRDLWSSLTENLISFRNKVLESNHRPQINVFLPDYYLDMANSICEGLGSRFDINLCDSLIKLNWGTMPKGRNLIFLPQPDVVGPHPEIVEDLLAQYGSKTDFIFITDPYYEGYLGVGLPAKQEYSVQWNSLDGIRKACTHLATQLYFRNRSLNPGDENRLSLFSKLKTRLVGVGGRRTTGRRVITRRITSNDNAVPAWVVWLVNIPLAIWIRFFIFIAGIILLTSVPISGLSNSLKADSITSLTYSILSNFFVGAIYYKYFWFLVILLYIACFHVRLTIPSVPVGGVQQYQLLENPGSYLDTPKINEVKSIHDESLNNVKDLEFFTISGKKCRLEQVVEYVETKPEESCKLSWTDMVKEEYKACSSRVAPANHMALLHALLVRHCISKVTPCKDAISKFSSWLAKASANLSTIDIVGSFADYLKTVEAPKVPGYKRGFEFFCSGGRMILKLVGQIKPDEKQAKGQGIDWTNIDISKTKPRSTQGPPDVVKAVCGYISWLTTRSIKRYWKYAESFVQAMKPEELQERVTKWARKIEDCHFVEIDQANHDAHQSVDFIRAVDNFILEAPVVDLAIRLGFSPTQISDIRTTMFSDLTRFEVHYPNKWLGLHQRRKYAPMIKGKYIGTTPSGHPNKTTLGNTIRIIMAYVYLAEVYCGLTYGKNFMILQSGDDTILCMPGSYLKTFKEHMDLLWLENSQLTLNPKKHGLGLAYKGFVASKYKVNFLSKEIYIDPNTKQASMLRILLRSIWTGFAYDKLKMKLGEFNSLVTSQFKSWAKGVPGYDEIIRWRERTLIHHRVSKKAAKKFESESESKYKEFQKDIHYYGFETAYYSQLDRLLMGAGSTPAAVFYAQSNPL